MTTQITSTKKGHLIVVSQNGNVSQAAVYDYKGKCIASADQILAHTKHPHLADPLELIYTLRACITKALKKVPKKIKIDAIGIWTNAPTMVIWDSETHTPISSHTDTLNTHQSVQEFKKSKLDQHIREVTGQQLTPTLPIVILKAQLNTLKSKIKPNPKQWKIGSLDTWWIYHLTQQAQYLSSLSHTVSTGLFNLSESAWDKLLIKECELSAITFPKVKADLSHFGVTKGFFPLEDDIPILAVSTSLNALHEAIRKTTSQSGLIRLDTTTDIFIQASQPVQNTQLEKIALPTKTVLQTAEKLTYQVPSPLPEWINGSPLETTYNPITIIPIDGKTTLISTVLPKLAILGVSESTTTDELITAYLLSIGYDTALLISHQFPNIQIKEINLTGPLASHISIRQTISDLLQIPVIYYSDTTLENEGITRILLAAHFGIQLPPAKATQTIIPLMDPISRYAAINRWETLKKNLSQ